MLQKVVFPVVEFIDEEPTYSVVTDPESDVYDPSVLDSDNYYLRENQDHRNLDIYYRLLPEDLPVEQVSFVVYSEATGSRIGDPLPGELDGTGKPKTGDLLHVKWPGADDPENQGKPRDIGFYRVQMVVKYAGLDLPVLTPISDGNDGQGEPIGWQCPEHGLAFQDLVWKHRPEIHVVDQLEPGVPSTVTEFMSSDASRLKEWQTGLPEPVEHDPLPATPPQSISFFFDLFDDDVPSTGDLEDDFNDIYGPTQEPRLNTLRTDAGEEAVYFSVSHGQETSEYLFLQYWMFENFSTGSIFSWFGAYPNVFHEGDIEYVQVAIPITGAPGQRSAWLIPSAVTASQHYYAQTLGWAPEDGSVTAQAHEQLHVQHELNERFVTYVALGSHATFLVSDNRICIPCSPSDAVLGNDAVYRGDCTCSGVGWAYDVTAPSVLGPVDYRLLSLEATPEQDWLRDFGGRWGFLDQEDPSAMDNGPAGPSHRAALRVQEDSDPVNLRTQPCRLHNLAIVRPFEEDLRIDECRQD